MTNKKNLENVIITNQSFEEAGGVKVYPDLEIAEVVITRCDSYKAVCSNAIEDLKTIALEKGYTHVFRIQETHNSAYTHAGVLHHYIGLMGTGYKPKSK